MNMNNNKVYRFQNSSLPKDLYDYDKEGSRTDSTNNCKSSKSYSHFIHSDCMTGSTSTSTECTESTESIELDFLPLTRPAFCSKLSSVTHSISYSKSLSKVAHDCSNNLSNLGNLASHNNVNLLPSFYVMCVVMSFLPVEMLVEFRVVSKKFSMYVQRFVFDFFSQFIPHSHKFETILPSYYIWMNTILTNTLTIEHKFKMIDYYWANPYDPAQAQKSLPYYDFWTTYLSQLDRQGVRAEIMNHRNYKDGPELYAELFRDPYSEYFFMRRSKSDRICYGVIFNKNKYMLRKSENVDSEYIHTNDRQMSDHSANSSEKGFNSNCTINRNYKYIEDIREQYNDNYRESSDSFVRDISSPTDHTYYIKFYDDDDKITLGIVHTNLGLNSKIEFKAVLNFTHKAWSHSKYRKSGHDLVKLNKISKDRIDCINKTNELLLYIL